MSNFHKEQSPRRHAKPDRRTEAAAKGFVEKKPASQKQDYDFRCPLSGRCGGCQLSGTPYRDQLRMKKQRVIELLGAYGTVEDVRGMQCPYHYRNKVHAVLGVDKSGLPVSGVYAAGTHHLVPVKSCLLEDRRADAIIRDLVAMLPKYKLRIYNEYTHRGFLRHILIRTGRKTG